jgi:aconitate hydratase
MRLPESVGVELTGKLQGHHRTDMVLALTEFLAQKVVGVAGVLGEGVPALTLGDRATIPTWPRNTALADVPTRPADHRLPLNSPAEDEQVQLVTTCQATGLWADSPKARNTSAA